MEKLDNTKPVENTPHQRLASSASPEEEKERIDKIFQKKQLGRPVGDFDSKKVTIP